MGQKEFQTRTLLTRSLNGVVLDRHEIEWLLKLSAPEDLDALFKTARQLRNRYFSNEIFLYGFIYFSTHCKNDCRFCQFRRSNASVPRYRKTESSIFAAAEVLADSGVHLIDLTMGEDPEFHSDKSRGFDPLMHIIEGLKIRFGLPVMVSPGVIPPSVIAALASGGTDWYACYQETHNRSLYDRLRPGQDYDTRIKVKQLSQENGMLIEEGILIGAGESRADIADSILWMNANDVHQARAMTFVPHKETPMAGTRVQHSIQELITIAVMRLVMPDRLIPASLDIDGLNGLKARLDAGANVITSIVSPRKGFSGVANRTLDIDDAGRTVDSIRPVLEDCRLKVASRGAYRRWLDARQRNCSYRTGVVNL